MQIDHVRHHISRDIPEDPQIAQLVAVWENSLGAEFQRVVGYTAVPLDGRFTFIRTQETNLGNLVADIMLFWLQTDPHVPVHAAFYNAGAVLFQNSASNFAWPTRMVQASLYACDDHSVALDFLGEIFGNLFADHYVGHYIEHDCCRSPT